jgi:hypothetical protein
LLAPLLKNINENIIVPIQNLVLTYKSLLFSFSFSSANSFKAFLAACSASLARCFSDI